MDQGHASRGERTALSTLDSQVPSGVVTASGATWLRFVASVRPPALEDAPSGLDFIAAAPSGDEGTREGGIAEVDRQRIVQHAACPRGRHRPPVRAEILVEPTFDPIEPRTEPVRWNPDPDAHRKASFGLGDHEGGASGLRYVPFLFFESLARHSQEVHMFGVPTSLCSPSCAAIRRYRCIVANLPLPHRGRSRGLLIGSFADSPEMANERAD
jgi:hypothetical protein